MHVFHLIFGTVPHDISGWQMSARAVLIVFYGLFLLRLFGQRIFTRASPLDWTITIIIGSNFSRTLTGSAPLIPTLAATTVMMAIYWIIALVSYHSRFIDRVFKGGPILLILDGKLDRKTMHRYGFTEGDILEELRKKGVGEMASVHAAYLEADGTISVLRKQ